MTIVGGLPKVFEGQTTSFGEASVAGNLPLVQLNANYELTDKEEIFIGGTGTATATDSMYSVTTGTTAGSFGVIRGRRALIYKAGQGAMIRITAFWPDGGVDGCSQMAGGFSPVDALMFGFQNEVFGIRHAHDGKVEVQELQITTPAAGAENATITIDGTGLTVPLTAGTVQHNAHEIALSLETQVLDYDFSQVDDTVVCVDTRAKISGAFAFSSATAVGAFTQIQDGRAQTLDFFAQADWNVDPMPDLDTTKGNVFQINFQYLGFGQITFSVEDENTGDFAVVHTIKWANNNTQPLLINPTLDVGWFAASSTSTTDVEVKGSSAAGFHQGEKVFIQAGKAASNTKNVGVTETNIMTIRCRRAFDSTGNRGEIIPKTITVANDGIKTVLVNIYRNATLGGETNYQYVDKANSIAEKDIAGTTIGSSDIPIGSFTVGGGESEPFDIGELNEFLGTTDTLTIAAFVISGAASDITATGVWLEDT